MRATQLIGLVMVVLGSFLPLVKIPVVGHWDYWAMDHNLAIANWAICALALAGILFQKGFLVKISSVLLLLLFCFTLIAIKFQSLEYFNFLPVESWKNLAASTVKLSWGWIVEFFGAILLFVGKKKS